MDIEIGLFNVVFGIGGSCAHNTPGTLKTPLKKPDGDGHCGISARAKSGMCLANPLENRMKRRRLCNINSIWMYLAQGVVPRVCVYYNGGECWQLCWK